MGKASATGFVGAARLVSVDFDLFGMLANFLYSGHHKLPPALPRLNEWHRPMGSN
jgi:hypothetical protein